MNQLPRKICLFLCINLTIILISGLAFGADFPQPRGAINDFANIISSKHEMRMNALAQEVQQKTGVSLVVATFKTVGDNDVDTFTNELYSAWGIGKKGKDEGVLMLVALKERRYRIETGYGVEGVLSDGLVGEIARKYMVPFFKKGDYSGGFETGMLVMAQILAKEYDVKLTGVQSRSTRTFGTRRSAGFGGGGLFFLILLFLLFSRMRRGRGGLLGLFLLGSMMGGGTRIGGGGFGSFGGGFGGFGGGMSGGGGAGGGF